MSAVQNVANSKACGQQVKSSIIAHQAYNDNGLFRHTQQQTNLFVKAIATLFQV